MNPDVCFVSASLYGYLDPDSGVPSGGAQRQQYLLGRELRDRGHDVGFLVADYGQPTAQVIDGMVVHTGCPETLDSALEAPLVVARLWRAMRRIDASVYYVRGAPRLAILTRLGSALLGKPMIFCAANDADVSPAHLAQRYGPAVRLAYRRMLGSADVVVAQTDRQQSDLRSRFGVDSVQIPNGYPLPSEGDVLPAADRRGVLWVGSSDPTQKRPELFLDLARRLPDLDFTMISQPMPDRSHHEELASCAADVENLTFLGQIPPDEIHAYYRRAALVVNTSAYEGFPNTFLEAWRYATPVVSLSFDLDGFLAAERGGRLSGSASQLRRDVRTVADEPATREALGWAGRRLIEHRFGIGKVAMQYERLVEPAPPAGAGDRHVSASAPRTDGPREDG